MRRSFLIIAVAASVVGTTQLSFAADMPVKAPAYHAPVIAAYYWSGFYLGGNVGYGWAHINSDAYDFTGTLRGSGSQSRDGVFGGGQIGYNFMINPSLLLGIEGDIDWAGISGSSDNCSATGCSHSDGKIKWFSTVRGRIGYVMNNWMIFATGGAAWTNGSATRTITSTGPAQGEVATGSGTHAGWAAGGGIEYGFAPHWSAALEYLYIETSGTTAFIYPYAKADRNIDSTGHLNTVRLQVDYHFN